MAERQVELFDDLAALADDAAGALDRAVQPSLYDRLDWWRLTARHISGIAPLVGRAAQGDARCWLALSRAFKRLEPLGSWYTLGFRAVFAPAGTRDLALLAAIARQLRGEAPLLALWPLDKDKAVEMQTAFAGAGWAVRVAESSANWRIDVSAGWQAYWAARPARLRNTVRRRRTKLTTCLLSDWNDELWTRFRDVFAASWKPAEGSWAFLTAFARAEAVAGALRLAFADADGRVVAAQLWTVENGVATLHKLAQRVDADALSPGTVLTAAAIETIIVQDGPAEIDFGTGDDRWKADWADQRRPLYTIEAADPRTLHGLARIARWRAAALVRRAGLR